MIPTRIWAALIVTRAGVAAKKSVVDKNTNGTFARRALFLLYNRKSDFASNYSD